MKTKIYLSILFACAIPALSAQGCSDAGICSLSKGHDTLSGSAKNEIEVAGILGKGESDTRYFSPFIAYTRNFSQKWSASLKITSSFASGSFGKRGSIGDAFLTASYTPAIEKTARWTYTAGAKIPFNRSNLKINNHPLPLDYQSSLGTFDFLGAVNLGYRRWDFNAAIQLPVFNINANSYFADYSGTADFPTTNFFERKPDALLRATYTLKKMGSAFTLKPNLLLIYHLGEDTYEDIYGKRQAIPGSDGLTLNGNLISSYHFKTGSVSVSLAAPFVVRDIRPDGLTREFTIGIGYSGRF